MNRQQIATVSCRALSLWEFTHAVEMCPYISAFLFGFRRFSAHSIATTPVLLIFQDGLEGIARIIVATFLWLMAAQLGHLMLPGDESPVTDVNERRILRPAMRVMGLYLIIYS